MKTWMYMCVHGRIIYDSQKGSNIFIYTHIHQLMNEWVKVVYLSKGTVFIQKKEISTDCASEWTNLENIIPSERNQTQKPHTVWFHWHEMPRIGKSVKQKTVDSMLPGDAKGISNLGWWSFLELVMVIAQSCAYIKNNCTFLQWFRWVLCEFYFKIFFKHLSSKFCSEW